MIVKAIVIFGCFYAATLAHGFVKGILQHRKMMKAEHLKGVFKWKNN